MYRHRLGAVYSTSQRLNPQSNSETMDGGVNKKTQKKVGHNVEKFKKKKIKKRLLLLSVVSVTLPIRRENKNKKNLIFSMMETKDSLLNIREMYANDSTGGGNCFTLISLATKINQ